MTASQRSNTLQVQIRSATIADIPEIAELHSRVFPGFFLSTLGSGFLRLFYSALIDSTLGFVEIAIQGGDIVGFVGACTDHAAFLSELLSTKKWRFAFQAARSAIVHPRSIPRLMRARGRGEGEDSHDACLMSIGVAEGAQGRGVGKLLVRECAGALALRGAATFCLMTDTDDNAVANSFYESQGFIVSRYYLTPEGRRMTEYRWPATHALSVNRDQV